MQELDYELDDPGFDSSQGQDFVFLFYNSCRLAVGPTQLLIRLVLAALFLGVKRLGTEADHSPRVRMIGAVPPHPLIPYIALCHMDNCTFFYA